MKERLALLLQSRNWNRNSAFRLGEDINSLTSIIQGMKARLSRSVFNANSAKERIFEILPVNRKITLNSGQVTILKIKSRGGKFWELHERHAANGTRPAQKYVSKLEI